MKKAIAGGTCLIAVAMAFAAKDPVVLKDSEETCSEHGSESTE